MAGFEKLAPEASLNDGKLDLIILKKCSLADFIRLASMALRGDHLNDPLVEYLHVDEIMLRSEDQVQLNLDGELGGSLPGRFSVLPHHLHDRSRGQCSSRHKADLTRLLCAESAFLGEKIWDIYQRIIKQRRTVIRSLPRLCP